MKQLRFLLLAIGLIALLAPARTGQPSDSKRKKARYFMMEGARQMALDNAAGAYEMFKRAYRTDPSYEDAAVALGTQRLALQNPALEEDDEVDASLGMIRAFVDRYHGDFFEAEYYAYLASHLDTGSEAIRIYERNDSLFPERTATLLRLAEAYMQEEDLPKAMSALDRYERREGMSVNLSALKVRYLLSLQDTAGSISEAERLVADNPRDPMRILFKGGVLDAIGKQDSALKVLLEAESIAPGNGAVKMSLADFYSKRGDSTAYDRKIYEALISEDFNLNQKGTVLATYLQRLINEKSNTLRGDTLFNVLNAQYPHEPLVLDLAARYAAAKGDFDKAAEQISYAIDMDMGNDKYWTQLLTYYMGGEKYDLVEETYNKSLDHVALSEDLIFIRGSALSLSGKYEEAIKVYGDLLALVDSAFSPTDSVVPREAMNRLQVEDLDKLSTIYQMIGDTYYQAKHLDNTYRAYDMSLYFMPDNSVTLNNYAYFLSENKGDLKKALEMSEKSNIVNPENPTYMDTYAWILFRSGKYSEAAEKQAKAIEIAEGNNDVSSELYSHYGDILFMNGDPDKALEYWKKALEKSPDDKLLQRKVKNKTFFYE